MICDYCGEELKPGEDVVEFGENIYCDDDCLHKDIDDHANWIIIPEVDN